MSFDYLLDKISEAPFAEVPFRHLEIQDFFSPQHFARIIAAPEIALAPQPSDEALFDTLFGQGYQIIEFPGCITEKADYIQWHRQRSVSRRVNTACEGFGITLRLMKPRTPIIIELFEFLASIRFQTTLAEKFGVELNAVFYDAGIQKYLDGYEISPHPDIRRKALTYMVNINPSPDSSAQDHHTHYLRFSDKYQYVQRFWEGWPEVDRCWVPWNWCETVKQQRANNSVVVFSPNNATMHGVKARYDHLHSQRTQLYGNLWYHQVSVQSSPAWEDLQIGRRLPAQAVSIKDRLKAAVPSNVKSLLRSRVPKARKIIAND